MALASTALYASGYFVALQRVPRLATSPYARASAVRRSGAAIVDLLLVGSTVVLYGTLGVWGVVLGGGYLVLRDSLHGRSAGKLIFGLMVVSLETGRPSGLRQSALRNFVLLVPPPIVAGAAFELYTVIGDPQGQRLGDRLASTQVVDAYGLKDLVADLQMEGKMRLAAPPRSHVRVPAAG